MRFVRLFSAPEFLTITARSAVCLFCTRNFFLSTLACSHKHSNVAYHFRPSGSRYQLCRVLKSLLHERSRFTFDFVIMHTLCKGSTSYKIRYLSMSSGASNPPAWSVSHLSLLSTRDQSNLPPAAPIGCRVVKSKFFFVPPPPHGIGILSKGLLCFFTFWILVSV